MTTDTIDIWHNIIVKVLILLKNKDIYSITFIKKFNIILKYGIKKVRSDNGKTIKETIGIKIQFKIIDSKFIDEINPKYSIISVGKNNRYGHPNKEVLENLKDSKVYRTDEDGSIMFKIKNNRLKIETCAP